MAARPCPVMCPGKSPQSSLSKLCSHSRFECHPVGSSCLNKEWGWNFSLLWRLLVSKKSVPGLLSCSREIGIGLEFPSSPIIQVPLSKPFSYRNCLQWIPVDSSIFSFAFRLTCLEPCSFSNCPLSWPPYCSVLWRVYSGHIPQSLWFSAPTTFFGSLGAKEGLMIWYLVGTGVSILPIWWPSWILRRCFPFLSKNWLKNRVQSWPPFRALVSWTVKLLSWTEGALQLSFFFLG